jgi:signal peptidase I
MNAATLRHRARRLPVVEQLPGRCHAMALIRSAPAVRDFGPCQGSAAHQFMPGDNRDNCDNSFDYRFYGLMAPRQIVGQAPAVVLSFDRENYWVPRWHGFFRSLDG